MDTMILERCIARMTEENGYPPTIRELSKRLGVGVATIHGGLTALEAIGRLTRSANSPRSMKLSTPTSEFRFQAARVAERLEESDPEAALVLHQMAAMVWENGLVWEDL